MKSSFKKKNKDSLDTFTLIKSLLNNFCQMKKNSRFEHILFLSFCLFLLLPFLSIAQTAPSNLVYNVSNGIAYRSIPQNSVAPTVNDGGATVTYSLIAPPAGVSINATTGQISWGNNVAIGKYTLTVSATNSVGATNTTYSLNVILNPDDFIAPKYSTTSTQSNLAYTGYISTANSANLVDVYTGVGDTNSQRPVFMFMHGGGFSTSNDKTQSYVVAFCKYMATCGYIAYAPNYNVGGGHTLSQNLKSCKDMDACLNSIRNRTINYPTTGNYKYNKDFLFVGGGSAGGHLSCNFVFADGSANYGGFTPNLTGVIAEADGWGSSPTTDRLYNFANLNANSMPTFIVQGSADQTVPVQESIDLDNALTAAGSYHSFWKIAGEKHGCPNYIPQISDSIARFYNRAWKRAYPKTVNAIVTPVRLGDFIVTVLGENININWTTLTEENTHHFEIERSVDGLNFKAIAQLEAKGNSTIKQHYSLRDNATLFVGTVYYRLKIVDRNGNYNYSATASIIVKPIKNLITSVYPNPVAKNQTLKVNYISTKFDKATVYIQNAIGQKIITNAFNVSNGNNVISLNINTLSSGLYYIVVSVNNDVLQYQPFMIK
jgi:acetyl esterase/lipase